MQKKNKQDVIYTYTLGLHQNKKKLNEIKKAEVTAMSDEAKKTVEPVVVVMDLGWGNTKYGYFVNGELIKDVMPSRVVESNDGLELIKIKNTTYDFRSDSTLVEIEDKVTKETTSHKLLAQKVLYEVHKKTQAKEFHIMAGCGLDSYIDDKGDAVKNNLFEKKFKIGAYDEDQVELEMKEMKICPETLSGGTALGLKLKGKIIILIDIGYLNFSMLEINDMMPQLSKDRVIVTANGMSKLLNDIVKAANNTTLGKLNITDTATMDKVVRNIKTYDENIQNLVEAGVEPFLQRIETELNNHFYVNEKIDNLVLGFVGGGSNALESMIRKYFKAKGYEEKLAFGQDLDPIYANLEGMGKRDRKSVV